MSNTFKCKCHFCGKAIIRKKQGVPVRLHFCNNICKGNHQRTFKPVTKEWLYDHYVTKRLDCTQIAHLVNRDSKSVWNWLKDFEIPTRKRGTTGNGWQHKGRPNPFLGKKHSAETRKKMSEMAKSEGRLPWGKNNPHPRLSGPNSSNWRGGITADRQKFYATPEWMSVAKKVWTRDKRTCQRCGLNHVIGIAFDIHHIVSFECKELRAVLSNLVLLCEKCHYWVHGTLNTKKEFIKPCP